MNNCFCGLLNIWTNTAHKPLKYSQHDDLYRLDIAKQMIPISFCFSCGLQTPKINEAYDEGMPSPLEFEDAGEEIKRCKCGLVQRWATDSSTNIDFDELSNEYYLTQKDWQQILRFCPDCGGKLVSCTNFANR